MSDPQETSAQYGERIGSAGPDSILSSFYRKILRELRIDIHRFQAILSRYVMQQGFVTNNLEISGTRSALIRELMSATMTWKVFMKGLHVLRIRQATITLTLYRDDEPDMTVHEYTFEVLQELRLDDGDSNTLANFLELIMGELEMTREKKETYLNHYVKHAKPKATAAEQYTTKCALKREIGKSRISWKIFIKSLIFLRCKRVKMSMQLLFCNDLVSTHHSTLIFR